MTLENTKDSTPWKQYVWMAEYHAKPMTQASCQVFFVMHYYVCVSLYKTLNWKAYLWSRTDKNKKL